VNEQQAFGSAVRRLRLQLGLSQEALAAGAGLDRTYVSSLERGRRNPALTTIVRLARALSVEAHVLLALMVAEREPANTTGRVAAGPSEPTKPTAR
jgi:transcriptional regulator with XRE-family HTH domain